VTSTHWGRNSEQTREHKNREHRGRHDGCAHEARARDKGLAHRVACLVVTRRAALRPRSSKALRVPRRAVFQCASAWLREGLGSLQEIVAALGQDSSPSSHRRIAVPTPCTAVGPANVVGASCGREAGGGAGTLTAWPLCASGSQGASTPSTVREVTAPRPASSVPLARLARPRAARGVRGPHPGLGPARHSAAWRSTVAGSLRARSSSRAVQASIRWEVVGEEEPPASDLFRMISAYRRISLHRRAHSRMNLTLSVLRTGR
jgi:hypothetical protein